MRIGQVQAAAVAALFYPQQQDEFQTTAIRIAALLTLLLAALGYGKIEAAVDKEAAKVKEEKPS